MIDSENRLVPSENPLIDGNLMEEILIPCKPTSKRWAVELIKDDDKVRTVFRSFLLVWNFEMTET